MVSLNLLVLRANDPERLARFYQSFGLCFRAEQHDAGPVHQACELDGSILEIYPASPHAPSTAGMRLGFRVPSLDDAMRACQHGGRIIATPALGEWGYRAVVEDPEGHKIELVEAAAELSRA